MNEAEWLAGGDAAHYFADPEHAVSGRKMRLIAAACARAAWRYLIDSRSRDAVHVAERYADGAATAAELATARQAAQAVCTEAHRRVAETAPRPAQRLALNPPHAAVLCVEPTITANAAVTLLSALRYIDFDRRDAAGAAHNLLIRCVAGNPFRPAAFSPAWRTADAVALAESIYARRAFHDLPVLADALEDAGCNSADLLAHLRDAASPHARGCWPLDLVLGRA